mmetsp:Transcript_78436/g.197024  ORF Transcript_78436/g.197024 Transcript_78436/m.197024 type:complete len:774 (-) Transcript_78436:27-2348(-)
MRCSEWQRLWRCWWLWAARVPLLASVLWQTTAALAASSTTDRRGEAQEVGLEAAVAAAAATEADDECRADLGSLSSHSLACAASWLQRRAQSSAASSAAQPRPARVAVLDVNTSSVNNGGECPTDTGGSCVMFSCGASRGEVMCDRRRCKCKPGFCNDFGVCRSPAEMSGAGQTSRGLGEESGDRCSANTGGKCRLTSCYGFRGPTVCNDEHQCVCQPGTCGVLGVCHKQMGTFKAEVWPVNQEHPKFPGHQGNISTALVLSGGGARSQIVSLGVLRALEQLGLMKDVDAISSVSGGTWAAAIYMFVDQDMKTLLGKATKPSELTLDELAMPPASLGKTATTSTTDIAVRLWWEGVSSHHLWIYTMGEAMLQPFDLNDKNAYMAPDSATVAKIKRENPQLQNASFLVPAPGRPKTLVMSGAILSPSGYKAEARNVVSLQMSPDFTGSPFYPDNGTVDYASSRGRRNDDLQGQAIGGGLVSTFAWGGDMPAGKGAMGGPEVKMGSPPSPLSLAKAVGVSSAGPASALTQVGQLGTLDVAKLNPRANIWGLLVPGLRGFLGDQATASYNLGDGGNIDNSGVLAMLQRKAQRIVWLINTGFNLPETSSVCDVEALDAQVVKKVDSQVRDKFGLWTQDDIGEFLTRNQVFREADLAPLLCGLAKIRDVGKPTVVSQRMEVQRNDWWGITGGFEVDMLFVYNEKCDEFVQALPQETRDEMDRSLMGSFKRFPHYLPVFQNIGEATGLTDSQVNLLAAHAEYMTMQTAPLFKQILEKGK